jgi:hypothetical protein
MKIIPQATAINLITLFLLIGYCDTTSAQSDTTYNKNQGELSNQKVPYFRVDTDIRINPYDQQVMYIRYFLIDSRAQKTKIKQVKIIPNHPAMVIPIKGKYYYTEAGYIIKKPNGEYIYQGGIVYQ